MAIAVPDRELQGITPEELQRRQVKNQGSTPEAQAFAAQIQGLPSYEAYVRTLTQPARGSVRNDAYRAVMAEAKANGIQIPDNLKMDASGSVREKTWSEQHQKLQAALIIGGFLGGGLALGAATAGAAAPAASTAASGTGTGLAGAVPTTGVGIGESSAMTGAAGSGFGSTLPATQAAGIGSLAPGVAPSGLMAGAGGGGMAGLSPEMWQIIASSGAGFLNNMGAGKNAKEQIAAQIASAEAARDPFAQQMSQVQNLGRLDAMEQMKPQQRAAPIGKYAGVVAPGQLDSYAPSADMLNWIASMKRDVSSGKNTAPTMTNPSNYGKTSVLNMPAPGTPLQTPPAGPYQPPTQPSLYDMANLSGGAKPQVQDKWGRSPGDPNYGKPPTTGGGFTF